jgi:hypothetical protein
MPAKNHTKHPQHVIDAAVKRHLDGESAAILAKYYGMSRPGFYLWVKKYKTARLEEAARPPAGIDGLACGELDAEVGMLRTYHQDGRSQSVVQQSTFRSASITLGSRSVSLR